MMPFNKASSRVSMNLTSHLLLSCYKQLQKQANLYKNIPLSNDKDQSCIFSDGKRDYQCFFFFFTFCIDHFKYVLKSFVFKCITLITIHDGCKMTHLAKKKHFLKQFL